MFVWRGEFLYDPFCLKEFLGLVVDVFSSIVVSKPLDCNRELILHFFHEMFDSLCCIQLPFEKVYPGVAGIVVDERDVVFVPSKGFLGESS